MNGIQIILLTGICFIGIYFILTLGKRVLDILLLSGMIICAIIFILKPGLTNIIANKLGVGRGADLVFYLSIVIFWFIILKLYIRIRKLEQDFTKIIRQKALDETIEFNSAVSKKNNL